MGAAGERARNLLVIVALVACSDPTPGAAVVAPASSAAREEPPAVDATPFFEPAPRRAPTPVPGERLKITFVSIGEPAPFWNVVHAFMHAAADDLDIDLEILATGGDHLRMVELVREVSARPPHALPHYLILNNEREEIGGRMLEHALSAGIPAFTAFNVPMDDESTARFGAPRERAPLWLGTIRPDNEAAGHAIATRLFRDAQDRFEPPTEVLAMSGTLTTPAAQARDRGLARAIAEQEGRFVLTQLVHSEWNRDKAARQFAGLLRRWPQTRVIWAANDPMALGALDAVRARGAAPGRDVLIGGLNWGTDALARVRAGELVTSVGGHFMGGAWTLVLLRDHADGLDFVEVEGGVNVLFHMGVIDRNNVDAYLRHFGNEDWSKIDFRRFLRSERDPSEPYPFTLEAILDQLEGDPIGSVASPAVR